MKKLLILVLILAMASCANAAVQWQLSPGSNAPGAGVTITLELVSTAAGDSVDAVSVGMFTDNGGAAGTKVGTAIAPVYSIDAGFTSQAFVGMPMGGDLYMVLLAISPGAPVVGIKTLFEYDYTIAGTALNGEVITFSAGPPGTPPGWTNNVTPTVGPAFVPAGVVVTVPEPMTIALLGLGGLFLRRRK